jgi:hypothetical protein
LIYNRQFKSQGVIALTAPFPRIHCALLKIGQKV